MLGEEKKTKLLDEFDKLKFSKREIWWMLIEKNWQYRKARISSIIGWSVVFIISAWEIFK